LHRGGITFPPEYRIKNIVFCVAANTESEGLAIAGKLPEIVKNVTLKSYLIPSIYSNKQSRLPGKFIYRPDRDHVPQNMVYKRHIAEYHGKNLFVNYGKWAELVKRRIKSFNKDTYRILPDVLVTEVNKTNLKDYTHKCLVVPVAPTGSPIRKISEKQHYQLYKILYNLSFINTEYVTEFLLNFDSVLFINDVDELAFAKRSVLENPKFKFTIFRHSLQKLSRTFDPEEAIDDADIELDGDAEYDDIQTPASTDANASSSQNVDEIKLQLDNELLKLPNQERATYKAKISKAATVNELKAIHDELIRVNTVKSTIMASSRAGNNNAPINVKQSTGEYTREIPRLKPAVYTKENIPTLNTSVRKSNLKGFNESYTSDLLKKDIDTVVNRITDKPELPLKLESMSVENTSDDLNRKDTYNMVFVDQRGGKHHVKIDVPRVFDGNRIRIGGGVKSITKQLIRLPVVKIKPTRVEISTNANKLTLEVPHSELASNELKSIRTEILKGNIPSKYYRRGSFTNDNRGFVVPMDYYEFSRFIERFTFKNITFVFSQKLLQMELKERFDIDDIEKFMDIYDPKLKHCCGIVGYTEKEVLISHAAENKLYLLDVDSDKITHTFNETLSELIVAEIKNSGIKIKLSTGKKLAHTRITVAKKNLTLASVLCIKIGLSNMLNKIGVDFTFQPSDTSAVTEDATLQRTGSRIVFSDGILTYNAATYRQQLITNGLFDIDFTSMKFEDSANVSSYVDYFTNRFGSPVALRSALNIISTIIDPITHEVLVDLGLPTNVDDLMIYASNLLDNAYHLDVNDARNYRIRGTEIIPATLARVLTRAYEQTLINTRQGKIAKMSVKQDALTKLLLQERIVEEVSILNPVAEAENCIGKMTFKGIGGINMERAFDSNNGEPRNFHPTMLGIFGLSTPDSGGVGIVKHCTVDMAINNLRGYIEPVDDIKDLRATNMLSISEMLSPLTNRKSDPPRAAIANPVSP
jgi:hypothetical protein